MGWASACVTCKVQHGWVGQTACTEFVFPQKAPPPSSFYNSYHKQEWILDRWTVAVDMLGNIIWICPLAPGTSADVLIWDGYGPSHTRGDFFDFEVGGHDGAYKGRIHVILE